MKGTIIRFFHLYSPYIVGVIILSCSFNEWSLWLDESSIAFLVSKPSWNSFIEELLIWKGSESQMPGYVTAMFLWEKIFGPSEYALRSFNMLLILLMFSYFIWLQNRSILSCKEKEEIKLYVLLLSISPLIVYNMNECRVNISIFCFASICLSSLLCYCKYRKSVDLLLFLSSFVFGYLFNLLFGFIGIPILFIAIYYRRNIKKEKIKYYVLPFLLCALITSYYIVTLFSGNDVIKEVPSVMNIGYVLYDFGGFGGVGAPKNELRLSVDILSTIKPYFVPVMSLLFAYCGMWYLAIKNKIDFKPIVLFLGSYIIFIGFAYLAMFRFWSRHLLMFYPIVLYILVEIIVSSKNNMLSKALISYFLVILTISSIRVATFDSYKKENIKEAISYVNSVNVENKPVVFMGFAKLADYYQLNNYVSPNYLDSINEGYVLYVRSMEISYKHSNKKLYNWLCSLRNGNVNGIWKIRNNKDFEIYRISIK